MAALAIFQSASIYRVEHAAYLVGCIRRGCRGCIGRGPRSFYRIEQECRRWEELRDPAYWWVGPALGRKGAFEEDRFVPEQGEVDDSRFVMGPGKFDNKSLEAAQLGDDQGVLFGEEYPKRGANSCPNIRSR